MCNLPHRLVSRDFWEIRWGAFIYSLVCLESEDQ